MAIAIKMPRLSDTMLEGVIKVWNKKVGDSVKPGDILAEVETDKATMDLEAYQDGVLLYIAVKEGAVPVDGLIAIIGQKGEDFTNLINPSKQEAPAAPAPSGSEVQINQEPSIPSQDLSSGFPETRIKASPLAKSLAKEKGLSLQNLSGSGEQGRIVKRDVEQLMSQPNHSIPYIPKTETSFPIKGDFEQPNSQMRKTIARRLAESKFSAPHFYLTMEIDMDNCVVARNQLNTLSNEKISFNDIIVKACAIALRQHPAVNVSWTNEKMIFHGDIHIGVAVAIDDGLVVPVIRNTDQKNLTEIRLEIQDKATRAKERKLNLDEMQGNTFTISNLGMYEIENFTAIINPPDACILAVGSILKKPAVKADTLVISNRMQLTLSCDHRAVDGATGAKFLQTLKGILENPIAMLL